MNAIAAAIVIVGAMAVDLVSDILIRPHSPAIAIQWDQTSGVLVVGGLVVVLIEVWRGGRK